MKAETGCRIKELGEGNLCAAMDIRIENSANSLGTELFWFGWGRRKAIGVGIELEEQTGDENGVTAYFTSTWISFCYWKDSYSIPVSV
jgi:hypothetical protein